MAVALLWAGAPDLVQGTLHWKSAERPPNSTLYGPLRIAGSSTVFPVTKAWAMQLESQFESVEVWGLGTETGADSVCSDSDHPDHVDISGMSRDWKPDEAIVLDDGYTLECVGTQLRVTQIAIGIDGLTHVVANGGVAHRCIESIGGLTLAQLRWIFTDLSEQQLAKAGINLASVAPFDDGDGVKEWSDISRTCDHSPINMYGAGPLSGTRDFFVDTVFGGDEGFNTCQGSDMEAFLAWSVAASNRVTKAQIDRAAAWRPPNCYASAEDDDMIVGWISADTFGIGFLGIAFYSSWSSVLAPIAIASDRTLGVGDTNEAAILPVADSIVDGSYEVFSRYLYVNIDNSAWAVARPFMDFAFSEEGQQVVTDAGYVRVNAKVRASMMVRIQEEGNEHAQQVVTSPTVQAEESSPGGGSPDGDVEVGALIIIAVTTVVVLSLLSCAGYRCHAHRKNLAKEAEECPAKSSSVAAAELSLLPALCDDVVSLDGDLCFNKPCPKLANMLSIPVDKLLGAPFSDLMADSDAERLRSHTSTLEGQEDLRIAPSLNVHLRDRWGTLIGVQLFVSRWEDLSESGGSNKSPQVGYFVGICQLQEHLAQEGGQVHTTRIEQRRMCDEPSSSGTGDTFSTNTDWTHITGMFGRLDAVFDGLSADFKIKSCSRAFTVMCGRPAVGTSLLDWVHERSEFLLKVQGSVNEYLLTESPAAFDLPFNIAIEASSRRLVEVSCRLEVVEWQSDNSHSEEIAENADADALLLCAVLTTIRSRSNSNHRKGASRLSQSSDSSAAAVEEGRGGGHAPSSAANTAASTTAFSSGLTNATEAKVVVAI